MTVICYKHVIGNYINKIQQTLTPLRPRRLRKLRLIQNQVMISHRHATLRFKANALSTKLVKQRAITGGGNARVATRKRSRETIRLQKTHLKHCKCAKLTLKAVCHITPVSQ